MLKTKILNKIPIKEKTIALTFDDGGDFNTTLKLVNVLKEFNIKCTFFLTGKTIYSYPEAANIIVNEGHEVGIHSFNHPFFTEIDKSEVELEINKCNEIIKDTTNTIPQPFIRPPYGEYNETTLDVISYLGYPFTILWTIDTWDWNGASPDYIFNKVINNYEPGSIVLMHVNSYAYNNNLNALVSIIKKLKSKNYKLIKISEMLSKTYTSPILIPYTVNSGDTLWKISNHFKTDMNSIIDINNIDDPNVIFADETLNIPLNEKKFIYYTVKPNDTLWNISEKFRVSVDEIISINNIIHYINVGQILLIPSNTLELTNYMVQPNDDLWEISNRFNVDINDLAYTNNLYNFDINIEDVLIIPNK